jgi:DNA-binding NarL/FixJ family response regulator
MQVEKPKHIFIVEDDEIYSMMLDYILSKDSIYHFVSFKSGEECLKNLYLNPDIIILDHGLPGISGYDTLVQIKKYNPNVHVIMLSGNKDKILAGQLIKAGADDFILKQAHGEKQIIKKIEAILNTNQQPIHKKLSNNLNKKVLYFILIFVLLTIGFITANK